MTNRAYAARSVGTVLARALTNAIVGLDARPVEVEAHLQRGLPGFSIVGLADKACQEAKERVRSGVTSAALEWPLRRITVNLAPADLPKTGSGFDLPIAIAVLAASRQIDAGRLRAHAALGELGLDGRVRPVPGTIAVAEAAKRAGLEYLICAETSAPEASLAGIRPVPVADLREACAYLQGRSKPRAVAPPPACGKARPGPDLLDLRGQERARRALEIAAAGRHALLLAGPPGTGKTMIARSLPSVLPPLDDDEATEVTRIHSIAGLLSAPASLVSHPPFRAPHHSTTLVALVGGGAGPRPGEVSLAHRGVLLLDELPEFRRDALEGLRQPLEEGVVAVARATARATFPASVLLVATMNLCPCGARGDARVECLCRPSALKSYLARVSRALLDRFDLVVAMPRVQAVELAAPPGETSASVRARVCAAQALAQTSKTPVDPDAGALLDRAVDHLPLSARGRRRTLRVAATIAALGQRETVSAGDIAEALSYRAPADFGAG